MSAIIVYEVVEFISYTRSSEVLIDFNLEDQFVSDT